VCVHANAKSQVQYMQCAVTEKVALQNSLFCAI
jgi:hypothetical protein